MSTHLGAPVSTVTSNPSYDAIGAVWCLDQKHFNCDVLTVRIEQATFQTPSQLSNRQDFRMTDPLLDMGNYLDKRKKNYKQSITFYPKGVGRTYINILQPIKKPSKVKPNFRMDIILCMGFAKLKLKKGLQTALYVIKTEFLFLAL